MASRPGTLTSRDSGPRPDEVRRFLSDNPDFLTAHPDLLSELTPPTHRRGEGVLDMQHYMIDRLRKQVAALRSEQRDLIAASRGNMTSQARVHSAVLALLEARSFEHLIETATTDLAALLGVDAVTLCVESDSAAARVSGTDGVFTVPRGRVDELLGDGRDTVLHEDAAAGADLFGGAATLVKSWALVRLPLDEASPQALLALGSRERGRFRPGQGTEPLCFLSRVAARCLGGWLDLPPP